MTARLVRVGGGAVILGSLLWLGGCAAKNDRHIYDRLHKHRSDFSMLQQSEKILFRHGEGNTTVAIVSYLPKESKEGERFILSVYPEECVALRRMKLDGQAPRAIEKISHTKLPEALRRHTPGWFDSYRILFPHTSDKKLTLSMEDAVTGEVQTLLFAKGPRYLVTKPKF